MFVRGYRVVEDKFCVVYRYFLLYVVDYHWSTVSCLVLCVQRRRSKRDPDNWHVGHVAEPWHHCRVDWRRPLLHGLPTSSTAGDGETRTRHLRQHPHAPVENHLECGKTQWWWWRSSAVPGDHLGRVFGADLLSDQELVWEAVRRHCSRVLSVTARGPATNGQRFSCSLIFCMWIFVFWLIFLCFHHHSLFWRHYSLTLSVHVCMCRYICDHVMASKSSASALQRSQGFSVFVFTISLASVGGWVFLKQIEAYRQQNILGVFSEYF